MKDIIPNAELIPDPKWQQWVEDSTRNLANQCNVSAGTSLYKFIETNFRIYAHYACALNAQNKGIRRMILWPFIWFGILTIFSICITWFAFETRIILANNQQQMEQLSSSDQREISYLKAQVYTNAIRSSVGLITVSNHPMGYLILDINASNIAYYDRGVVDGHQRIAYKIGAPEP